MSLFDVDGGKAAGGKPTAQQDRRGHPRTPVILHAQLETANGRSIDCTVLDMSARGARVAVPEPLGAGGDKLMRVADETRAHGDPARLG